ncbi:MAG TPA: hypothetical protein VM802_24595 [Chitinophaga sp.]|uniref:hypothetical protein n=1 Tax=Chitinophaga sp. TaxID=1869181 RepID=UPI002CDC5CB8|nr:hypothetical protein [Chitinophaga sp.]HVI48069.1 hypothetical protein [Chitinophaga sp.]
MNVLSQLVVAGQVSMKGFTGLAGGYDVGVTPRRGISVPVEPAESIGATSMTADVLMQWCDFAVLAVPVIGLPEYASDSPA